MEALNMFIVRSKDGKSRLPQPLSHLYASLKHKDIDWKDFFGASDYFRNNKEENLINTTTGEKIYDDRIAFKEFIDYCYNFYERMTHQGPKMGYTIRDMLHVYNHNLVGKLFADKCVDVYYVSDQQGGCEWDRYTYFCKNNIHKYNFSIDQIPIKYNICKSLKDFYFSLDIDVGEYFSKEKYKSSTDTLFSNNVSDLI